MARINVEDSLYKDLRFINLIVKFGSLEMALGSMVRAWSLAQEHYLDEANERLIPHDEWNRQKIRNEILEVGLAEQRAMGIYVHGAKEQFEWLIQKQEAGKKSGETRQKKGKKNHQNSEHPSSSVEHPLTPVQQNPTEPNERERSLTSEDVRQRAGTSSSISTLSLTQDITKKDNTVVASSKPSTPPTAGEFSEEINSLRQDPVLLDALKTVKDGPIRFWVTRYELEWLKNELRNAYHHHIDNGNAQKFAVTGEWGPRLGRWLRGARNPILRDSGADTASMIEEFEAEFQKNGEVMK